jgi:hypothetical protein
VTGAFGRDAGVDHLDTRFIILIKDGGAVLSKAKFTQNGAKILGNFGSRDRSDEFGFS